MIVWVLRAQARPLFRAVAVEVTERNCSQSFTMLTPIWLKRNSQSRDECQAPLERWDVYEPETRAAWGAQLASNPTFGQESSINNHRIPFLSLDLTDGVGMENMPDYIAKADASRDSGTSPPKSPHLEQDMPSVSGIVDAILEIGRERSALLARLRIALESGQEREALMLSRRLCGITL